MVNFSQTTVHRYVHTVYMLAVASIVSRHGYSINACHRYQSNKSKHALYKPLCNSTFNVSTVSRHQASEQQTVFSSLNLVFSPQLVGVVIVRHDVGKDT